MTENLRNAIIDVQRGYPVIVIDDYDRENEGDIVIAAEKASYENINFCMKYARGLMCIPCSGKILDALEIPMMVVASTDKNQTPFTVSVDAAKDTSTGMSVDDRLKTIEVFVSDKSKPEDLNRPGHLFPLRAKDGLLKERRGHTEGSIALMLLAKMQPVSIIVEVINDNGTMARLVDLVQFTQTHKVVLVSISEIYEEFCKQGL